jgi:LuxR family maltose regulon positive regulatory protein
MAQICGPFVVVLDDAQMLTDGWSVIENLVARVPPGSVIAIASRRVVPIHAGSGGSGLRSDEFSARELAFDAEEARVVLSSDVSLAAAHAVVDRCDGWPVGVSLAGLGAMSRSGRQRSRHPDSGSDMDEYLRVEVLADLDEETRTFLTRSAVLREIWGEVCDAVCDCSGSALLLRGRLSDDLLITPVPGGTGRYRCHRLLRQALLADLRVREPELIPELHARASRWLGAWPARRRHRAREVVRVKCRGWPAWSGRTSRSC